ncbi:reverse transcriptase domain-containing protein, partial [Tanacetum coccineum]
RAEAPSTSHSPSPHIIVSHTRADTPSSGTPPSGTPPLLPIPLLTSSPPLHLLFTDRRVDRFKVTLPPQKRLCFALDPRYEVGESSSAAAARPTGGFKADYGFVAIIDREIRWDLERGVRDRRAHARTCLLMEREARMSREAWGRSMDASDLAHLEVMSLRTIVLGQQVVITELQAADRRRHATITELLAAMIDQGVTAALAARDADRNTNGDDSHNSGTGVRRTERTKMESVFRISNYFVENQIKFSTFTLLGNALTWWNSHVRTVGNDIAYAMTWTKLKKKITDKYCLRTEIKKLKVKLWELKVKGTDMIGYNQRFQELALLCGRMFPEESDKIEKYVGGLPDMIHRKV